MDPSSQFIVPTIIDVPELIVTNEDIDFEDSFNAAREERIWVKRLRYVSSIFSYVIGLSNVWRFPYLCYKYEGGAFLIAYTMMLVLIGYPLLLMELAFGQYANEGPITIWRISPAFEGIGYVMCLISAMVAVYYNVVNTWILHYLFGSLRFGPLPWSVCDNEWNSDKCFYKPDRPVIMGQDCHILSSSTSTNISQPTQLPVQFKPESGTNNITFDAIANNTMNLICNPLTKPNNKNASMIVINSNGTASSDPQSIVGFERIINSTNDVVLPTNEYFHNHVLSLSTSLTSTNTLNKDTVIYLIFAYAIVFIVIMRGLRLNGHLSVASVIVPYLMFITLFIRAVTLEGALDGLLYYITPNWEKFRDIDIWADATTQSFFALAPCWGGLITLASMNKFHNSFQNDAIKILSLNYATSIFIGLVSFAILGFMSNYSGIEIDQLVESGQGFIFMVFPEALSRLPLANLNSLIFFSVLLFIGLKSELNVIETVITTIVDTWPHKLRYRRPLILMILCATMYLLSSTMCFGNGFHILQLFDSFSGTYIAMIIGLLELIALSWIYGVENFQQDIDDMISVHKNLFPSRNYWHSMWRYLTPSLLFAITLFSFTDLEPISYRQVEQPAWSLTLAWTLTFISLSIIPAIAFIRFLLSPRGSITDRLAYLCRPSEDWAPSSYVSGPKLLNRHMHLSERDSNAGLGSVMYSSSRAGMSSQDQESNDSNDEEDLKVVNGRANYIIPEEEDDTDTGLIGTNETNL